MTVKSSISPWQMSPERKNDLVEGKYVVEAKKGATLAVKVTDMLGEEVLVVRGV